MAFFLVRCCIISVALFISCFVTVFENGTVVVTVPNFHVQLIGDMFICVQIKSDMSGCFIIVSVALTGSLVNLTVIINSILAVGIVVDRIWIVGMWMPGNV